MDDKDIFDKYNDTCNKAYALDLSSVVKKTFPSVKYIADVCAGSGILNFCLKFINAHSAKVVSYDIRDDKEFQSIEYLVQEFNKNADISIDLITGMHVCKGISIIFREAFRRRIPFIITPCCYILDHNSLEPITVEEIGDFYSKLKEISRLEEIGERNDFVITHDNCTINSAIGVSIIGIPK